MLTTVLLFVLLLAVDQIHGRTFHIRQTDSLTIMRDKCAQNPYAEECTRVKQQMEDLLRKCSVMLTPVPACKDVKDKFCFIWPRELYCFSGGGGGGGQVTAPPSSSDPDWNRIPYDSHELRSRGDYCVPRQAEQKCRNLMSAIRVRYEECSKLPKTDAGCQSFKVSLCAAFPKYAPCLNGGSGFKRRATELERLLRMRRKVSTF